jgi:hypothetical protein
VLEASRVFDVAAGDTATYVLVCAIVDVGSSLILAS